MSRGKIKDITGKRFGKLVVVEMTEKRVNRHVVWRCVCDCGNECFVRSTVLTTGRTKSCGCNLNKARKNIGNIRRTHGRSSEKIYFIWQGMRKRCSKEYHKNYKDYGGRGISVCNEWNDSFENFFDYVSQLEHYGEEGYSLDRIDNNGNYEPGNVKWSTQKEQCNNRRHKQKRKE